MYHMKASNKAYEIIKGIGAEFTESNKTFVINILQELEREIRNDYGNNLAEPYKDDGLPF